MKLHKFFLLTTVLSSIFPSCTKKEVLQSLEKKQSVTQVTSLDPTPLSAGDNQYDLLGFGYDVTGRFANSESAKFQVINIEKFVTENPYDFDVNTNVEQYFDYSTGTDAVNYTYALSQAYTATKLAEGSLPSSSPSTTPKAENTFKFKQELNFSFESSNKFSSKYIYGSAYLKIKQKRLRISATINEIITDYLIDNFKSDILNLTPSQLVAKYGTHVLINITLGAKLEMNYRSETINSDRTQAVKAGLSSNGTLKYFGIGIEAAASSNLTYNQQIATSNFNQTFSYRTVGGDGTKGLVGTIYVDNSNAPQISISQWQSSCTRENAALIEIAPDGLINLYDLIEDPLKKEAVKSYIDQYLFDNQVNLNPTEVYEYYNSTKKKHAYSLNPKLNELYPSYPFNNTLPFKAFATPVYGAIPIYQFINPSTEDHVLTSIRYPGWSGFNYDGILFYAYSTQLSGTVPIYEFYNSQYKNHYYSTNRNATAAYSGWSYNGVAFYAFMN